MSVVALLLAAVVIALAAPAVTRSSDPVVKIGGHIAAIFLAVSLVLGGTLGVTTLLTIWAMSALVVAIVVALLLLRWLGQTQGLDRPPPARR